MKKEDNLKKVFVCPSTRAPINWFNRYAYLGVSVSC